MSPIPLLRSPHRHRRRPRGGSALRAASAAAVRRLLLALSAPALTLQIAAGTAIPGLPAAAGPAPAEAGSRPGPAPAAPATGTFRTAAQPPLPPLSPAAFAALLQRGDLEALQEGCRQVIADDRLDRLRLIRDRLLTIHPAPQPLPVVLANASVLISCHQPQAALTVLDRLSPAAGAERLQWLLLEWRAAHAALDHRRAAIALARLSAMAPAGLEGLDLPLAEAADGRVLSRPAIELLAEHLQARGFPRAAAELLLASQISGPAGARRRLEAVSLLASLPAPQREALLDAALDQAAAAGAWGLVAEILDAQAALPSARAEERRLRLSPRIDDAYGEWLIRRRDPAAAARSAALERELRSPLGPGGHGVPAPPAPPHPGSPVSPSALPSSQP